MSKNNKTNNTPVPTQLSSGAWTLGPTATITCEECGAERVIKIQDRFQVKRCVACQKAHEKATRNEAMKAKSKAKREARAKEEAKALIASLTPEQLKELMGQ